MSREKTQRPTRDAAERKPRAQLTCSSLSRPLQKSRARGVDRLIHRGANAPEPYETSIEQGELSLRLAQMRQGRLATSWTSR